MNRDYEATGDGAASINGLKDSKSKTGISLIIGKQIFEDSNVTFESFFGIGFASIKTESSKIETIYGNGSTPDTYRSLTTSLTESKPNFQLGLRIGFGN